MFVKLDRYTGTQLSTDVDKHNIVPFSECVNEIRLTVNGTHYMRWQLPLILAYSITTHKSQSMTANRLRRQYIHSCIHKYLFTHT